MRAMVLVIALLVTVALGAIPRKPTKKPMMRQGQSMTLGPRNYEDIPTDFLEKFDKIAANKLDRADLTPEARASGMKIKEFFKTNERKAACEKIWVFLQTQSVDILDALYNLDIPGRRRG